MYQSIEQENTKEDQIMSMHQSSTIRSEMKRCTFLIVTPVLNGAEFIAECILSVKEAFKHFGFVHIVIEGGSTDRTEEIIENNKHSNLIFLKMPGSNMYQAINRGINLIEADYFYQLNADDLVLPGTPELVYKYFKNDNTIDVFSGSILTVDVETKYCKLKVPMKNQFSINKIGINLFVNQPSTFVKYKVMKEIGGFNEIFRYASDTDVWLKLIKKGYKFRRIDKCLSIDRVHSNCVRLSNCHIQELNFVRKTYRPVNIFLPVLKLYNSILFLFTQLFAIIKINNFLPDDIKCFGTIFFRMYGVFFTTKRAGIILSYPFFKGVFGFKGRFF